MKTPPRLFAFLDAADAPETSKASQTSAIHSGLSGKREVTRMAALAFEKLVSGQGGILPKDYILKVVVKVTPR